MNGRRPKQLRVGPFELAHRVLTTRDRFEHHRHRRSHLVMVFSGVWSERTHRGTRNLGVGEILFHPSGYEHQTRAAAPGTEIILMFIDPEAIGGFCPLYGDLDGELHVHFEAVRAIPDMIREELLQGDEASPFMLQSLATQLLALGSRVCSDGTVPAPPWLTRALDTINDQYARPLTVASIAKKVGISPSRLAHVFSDVVGRPMTTYIRETRVRAAAKALRESSMPIGEIALACGFYDQSHLARAFKAVRGVTPRQYRLSQHIHTKTA